VRPLQHGREAGDARFWACCSLRSLKASPSVPYFARWRRAGGAAWEVRRVARGGSWNNNQHNARASVRNDNHPDNRNNNIGFRVVCVSHIKGGFQARRVPAGNAGRPGLPGRGDVSGWRRLVLPARRAARRGKCSVGRTSGAYVVTDAFRADGPQGVHFSLTVSFLSAPPFVTVPSVSTNRQAAGRFPPPWC
jgi:hypothetical protein